MKKFLRHSRPSCVIPRTRESSFILLVARFHGHDGHTVTPEYVNKYACIDQDLFHVSARQFFWISSDET